MNNWLDIAIVVVGLIVVGMGVRAGLIGLLTTVIGGVVGLLAAWFFNVSAAQQLAPYIENAMVARVVGFLVVGALAFGAVRLLGFLVRRVLSALLLGWVDRVAGGVVGLVFAILVTGGFVWVLNLVPLDVTRRAVAVASLAPRVSVGLDLVTAQVARALPTILETLNDPAVSAALRQVPGQELAASLLGSSEEGGASSFQVPTELQALFDRDPLSAIKALAAVVPEDSLESLATSLLRDQAEKTVREILDGPHSEALESILGKDYEQLLEQLPESLETSTLLDLLTDQGGALFAALSE
jgi:membrane protein required for colicin V production